MSNICSIQELRARGAVRSDSKIHVAGHRGLLGSAIVRKLGAQGFENLLLKTSAELDLRDQSKTFDFLAKEKPDYMFVSAARVGGIKANIDSPASFLYENLAIQNNLIEGARLAGVKKLLFVGSSCIYPREAKCPITENALLTGPLEPTNEGYALAKIAGIRMCQFYRKQHGCDFISAIPTNLYGPGDHYDLEKSHLVPALILKLHRLKEQGGTTLDVWGSGKPRREFMLNDDCADALVFMMKNHSGDDPLNVGIGHDLTIVEIAETIAKVMGMKIEIRLDLSKPDGMMRKVLDVSKLAKMGWTSKVGLEDGVRIAWQEFLKR